MYAVRLNANETSIDCLQQVNVLTRPKFKASEMATFSETAESRSLACGILDSHKLVSVEGNNVFFFFCCLLGPLAQQNLLFFYPWSWYCPVRKKGNMKAGLKFCDRIRTGLK
jgi:hypothetical protein